MADLPSFVSCPAHVRAVDFGHVLVLIDYATGGVRCLLPAASISWHRAARTGRSDSMSPALAHRLVALGLLAPAPAAAPWSAPVNADPAPPSWGSTEHPAGTRPPSRTPLTATLGAAVGLSVAFAATRLGGMRGLINLLDTAASTCRRPATPAQVNAAVLAVRRAGWYAPGRTACLEESAAAVLLLAGRRRAVRWCHGVASDPVRLHAWVQTEDGAHAAEPPSTRAYTPVLTIGGRHQHHP
ncbi:lasso peptide biosynthesis B2 protein [Streptomyces niveus]|uniref:lasso peptide biosynthesis B2 protein n=1 Tax=Streptomyces niveus TaxID=193462 RepID=UPI003646A7F0